ncbi:MAG: 30S ribosomal protein S6 [Candidatus Omnitrophota bacterium]
MMMNKYEAMVIIKPDLSEEERNDLFKQLADTVSKNNGEVSSAAVWSEKRKLIFPIKKQQDGVYYLMNFTLAPQEIAQINRVYKLNENVLRVLITRQ